MPWTSWFPFILAAHRFLRNCIGPIRTNQKRRSIFCVQNSCLQREFAKSVLLFFLWQSNISGTRLKRRTRSARASRPSFFPTVLVARERIAPPSLLYDSRWAYYDRRRCWTAIRIAKSNCVLASSILQSIQSLIKSSNFWWWPFRPRDRYKKM